MLAPDMTREASTEAAVVRELLKLALHNAGRSVFAQLVVATYIVWVGWRAGEPHYAVAAGLIGVSGTAWRWWLARRFADTGRLDAHGVALAKRSLEGNAALAGALWAVSVVGIYTELSGTEATAFMVDRKSVV